MIDGRNYVSFSVQRLKKRLMESSNKTEAFKESVKETITYALEDFEKRLRSGEVKINNVSDFEKLVKLGLLLYGEATEKIEHTTDVEGLTLETFNAIQNTEEFNKLKEKLAMAMNKANEQEE